MLRSSRLHAVRSSWRRQLPTVSKLFVALSVIGFFFWNVSTIARLSHSPTLRSEGPRAVAQGLRDAFAHVLAARDSEENWWLRPDTYRKADGCDFSAAVALFKPQELELNCANMDELPTGEFVGKGFWRQVYKTQWNGRDVAVKRVKEDLLSRPDIIPRHVEECAAIFSIRNEPNIVGLVGWCKTTVVVDYIPHQLDTLLFESQEQLNDFNRVKYTGPRMVNGVATSEKCTFETSVAKGKWRSPEEYQHLQLDEKLDIYSLSLVLWALRARVKPFRMLEREKVYQAVPTGVRPPVSAMSDYPQQMQDLIVRGWDTDPKKRPTAKEMADEINRILEKYEDNR
ncbi:hypothetical protein PRNP1_010845 [Phytophthora ramorum]